MLHPSTIQLCVEALANHREMATMVSCLPEDAPEVVAIDRALADIAQHDGATIGEEGSLLRCPFCGGEAATEEAFYDCNHYWVQCRDCKNGTWSYEEGQQLAIDAWNRRVVPAAAPVPTPAWEPMHPDDADLLRKNIPAIASLYNQGYEIARRIQRQGSEDADE